MHSRQPHIKCMPDRSACLVFQPPRWLQVFNATSPDSTAVIDSGQFVTPSPRNNITHALHNLADQVYYNVWLAAEDMQSPPLQQSTASLVAWQQPFLLPPQMNASLVAGSMALGDRCVSYLYS